MQLTFFKSKLIAYLLLAVFSFYINYYFANIGLYPIDTFTFFDSGYLILQNYHPIKDYWVISGILVDYLQALFFLIFGLNWNSYIIHSSVLNSFISLFFFYFMNIYNKNLLINLILGISFALLCYPVAGTPFPYQHSFIFSLASILIFYLAVDNNNKKLWFLLPIFMFMSFFSMQLPAGLINIILIIFSILYFLKIDKKNLIYFLYGTFFSLTILIFYFHILKINFNDFLTQIILFPLDIGGGRISGSEEAFASANFFKRLTLRGTLGHFKFINLFIFINLFVIIKIFIEEKKIFLSKRIILDLVIFFSALSFIFHQIITANQTFIFSLIPFLCGLTIIQVKKLNIINNFIIKLLFVCVIIFASFKYYFEYNDKRKFMDLQNVDLTKSEKAKQISKKFKNLNWITPSFSKNPQEEINLLKEVIEIINSDDEENIALITHYQFFSLILEKKFHIINRWYFPQNNTHPTTYKNKYYTFYNKKINLNLKKNKIKKIYFVETYLKEFDFINYNDFLKNICYSKKIYNKILFSLEFEKCFNN